MRRQHLYCETGFDSGRNVNVSFKIHQKIKMIAIP